MIAKSVDSKNLLPRSYVLNDYDVVCGRGRTCFNHAGNVRFREIVSSHLQRYMNVNTKTDKTIVICNIVDFIRETSPTPGGGFVKLDKSTGRYYEVGDFLAKEKTSQAFRDLLKEKYKSSNANKRFNRKIRRHDGNRGKQNCTTAEIVNEQNIESDLSDDSDCYSSSRSQQNTLYSTEASVDIAPSVFVDKQKNIDNDTSYSLSDLEKALKNPSLRRTINLILTEMENLKNGTITSRKNLKHNVVQLSKLLKADNDDYSVPPVDASQPIWWENDCGNKIELHSTKNKVTVESGSIKHPECCLESTQQQDQQVSRHSFTSSTSSEYDLFNSFVPFDDEDWMILKDKSQNVYR